MNVNSGLTNNKNDYYNNFKIWLEGWSGASHRSG
jgi:hypothetical protein